MSNLIRLLLSFVAAVLLAACATAMPSSSASSGVVQEPGTVVMHVDGSTDAFIRSH